MSEPSDQLDLYCIIESLMAARQEQKLSQRKIAEKIQASKTQITNLEVEKIDPKLSFLQRYARAVGGRIEIRLVRGTNGK